MNVCVNLKNQTCLPRNHRVSNRFVRTKLQLPKTKEIVSSTTIELCSGEWSPIKVHQRWDFGPKQYPKAQRTFYETPTRPDNGHTFGLYGPFGFSV